MPQGLTTASDNLDVPTLALALESPARSKAICAVAVLVLARFVMQYELPLLGILVR